MLWAAHQTHHSSEQYTLATALRKSVVQPFAQLFFYLPLALALPPPIFYAHMQLNLLYQFYIHTEARRVAPLNPLNAFSPSAFQLGNILVHMHAFTNANVSCSWWAVSGRSSGS